MNIIVLISASVWVFKYKVHRRIQRTSKTPIMLRFQGMRNEGPIALMMLAEDMSPKASIPCEENFKTCYQ